MKKVIIRSFLSLTALTTIPLFGMTETKGSKDTSMSVVTPSTQTTNSIDEDEKRIITDFEEALQSYKIDPKQIDLVVKDVKDDRYLAGADSLFKYIEINKHLVSSDEIITNFRIFIAYHEAGHLYDKANQKRLFAWFLCTALGATLGALVSTAVNCLSNNESSILKDIASDTTWVASLGAFTGSLAYLVFGNYYDKKREKEANRLAIEHLLKDKKYAPIIITFLCRCRARWRGLESADNEHPSYKEECNYMIKCVRDNGFKITFKSDDKDLCDIEKEWELSYKPTVIVCLEKDGKVLTRTTADFKLPELSTDD